MKKMTRLLALILALSMLSTVAVGAEGSDAQGVYNIAPEAGYTLVPLAANPDTESAEKFVAPTTRTETIDEESVTVHENTIAFDLTFTGEEGVQYVVFLLSPGETVPKEGKIRYIDQKADGASMSFTLYPDDITEPGTYGIYLSSSKEGDAYKKVASFTVTEKPYLLGDVDLDKDVDSADAALVLEATVRLVTLDSIQEKAAMVSNGISFSSEDAAYILQYVVRLINKFPVEG